MKFENTEVWGFEHALRGMRNPKNSWHKSDSQFGICNVSKVMKMSSPTAFENGVVGTFEGIPCYITGNSKIKSFVEYIAIGKDDMKLAQTLICAGSEHRKFMRQIFVSVDITAPLYWWKEFDTYKVGTVANSTSTMHKLSNTPITLECFEIDDYCDDLMSSLQLEGDFTNHYSSGDEPLCIIDWLESLRLKYLETKDKKYWKELIRWLPEGWLQTRTVTMNYENLLAMCSKGQRRFHKLNEWSGVDDSNLENFISWVRTLPYAQEFIFIDEAGENA